MSTKHILLAYITECGSTEDVARTVAETLQSQGLEVEMKHFHEINTLEGYDGAIIGAPMILGWHRAALQFIHKHQQALSQIPTAYFFTAMSLTDMGEKQAQSIPVWLDPDLAVPPRKPGKPGLKERYASVSNYLGRALKAAPGIKPISAAFFGGKLAYYQLKPLPMLFVMLIIQAQPGDKRNFDNIRAWAASLGSCGFACS